MAGIKNVFGGASIQSGRPFGNVVALRELFDVLKTGNCHTVDTSTLYGSSEGLLGKAGAAQQGIVIDTKTSGGISPGGASYRGILSDAERSRERLGQDVGKYKSTRVRKQSGCCAPCRVPPEPKTHFNADILYIHAPDESTPLDETLAGINQAYKSGFFKRFGLSNFLVEDVREVYDKCKQKGYPLPTVCAYAVYHHALLFLG